MINKIIVASLFFCLIVALVLASFGIHQVSVGVPFLSYLRSCSNTLNDYQIAIPNIPDIPSVQEIGGFFDVLNAVISFLNNIVKLINVLIQIINIIVQMIEFVVIMVTRFDGLIEALKASVVA